MKKILMLYSLIALLSIGIAFSHGEDELADAKQIIENKVPCSELTEDQLEHMGDYYMEQMHSGEAHELMDKMMGGEGSESLRQMHIAMAKRIYCDDTSGMANYGMMGMMMGGNMMGGQNVQSGMMQGMMGNLGYSVSYWNFVNVLYLILLIGLIILVYFWIIKLFRGSKKKR